MVLKNNDAKLIQNNNNPVVWFKNRLIIYFY